ncbi:phosphate ABC transporter ATP-binding protein PstB [Oenococcus oeni]|uniref:phosphate ABC transporter ATP-binding protein PstB n=1 Tax=Oenococcus oeni TaxID=1247 RepID=UPI000BDF02E6|nr:phosphate ABC transporter ATP-binding protein PstB [Oenococcus oeni]PDH94618.1 phosphate ABC transporter ATP-binding protein [Oenococcus oeni]
MAEKENYLLTTKNVNLFYGMKQALFDINLSFPKNGITALIGPSGSGKTTYLRSLNRMHDLTPGVKVEGKFLFHNNDIYSDNFDLVDLRKRIGMVFQQPTPFPFSVYDNVAFGLRLGKKISKHQLDEDVEKALRQAGVWNEVKDRLGANASGLSGGQQQRVSVARVLATKPDILLLDEPTSALDPISSRVVEDSLLDLKKEYCLIIVTHNMQQAARISQTTAFFNDGRLIEVGKTREIFLNPKEEETQDYVSGKFG